MAQLNSPGVSVTVIDESFYTSASPGTVPLIIVASAGNKQNGSSTGIAPGTLASDYGTVRLLTSQKDLSDVFGTPIFNTDTNNNPIHAGELNEYGLQAAYSYLGVSNRAYVVRANLDLNQLVATSDAPTGNPVDGTYWFDCANTHYGIFEWNSTPATVVNGQTFTNKIPSIITDVDQTNPMTYAPLPSFGSIGDYAMVCVTNLNKLWYKKSFTGETSLNGGVALASGTWVAVGTPEWVASWPAAQGSIAYNQITLDDANVFTVTVSSITFDYQGSLVTPISSLSDLVSVMNADAALVGMGITAAIVNNVMAIYTTGLEFSLSGMSVATVGLIESTYKAPALQSSPHFNVPKFKLTDDENLSSVNGRPTGSIWVKTTNPNLGASWVINRYNASTMLWTKKTAPLYMDNASALAGLDSTGGGSYLTLGDLYVKYNDSESNPTLADFKIYARSGSGQTSITSSIIQSNTFTYNSTYSFSIAETTVGSVDFTDPVTVSFTILDAIPTPSSNADAILTALTGALINSNITATKTTANQIVIKHVHGGDIKFVDDENIPVAMLFSPSSTLNFQEDPSQAPSSGHYVASLWIAAINDLAVAPPSVNAPTTEPEDGALWYNSVIHDVDIMVNNGTNWVGYRNFHQSQGTDVNGTPSGPTDAQGPIISSTRPTLQSDGLPLANGDLWIDTSDLENYPKIYKYNYNSIKWVLVDNSDQVSENGIVFRDARWNTDPTSSDPSTIVDLLGGTNVPDLDMAADFVDFDAPDPALYPAGMLLWNLRRSGYNVKRFVKNYINILSYNSRFPESVPSESTDHESMAAYYPHRWVSDAPNQIDGSGSFGRKSQREVVIQALTVLINSNQQIRDEEGRLFNLIACPGYPELINPMVSLNYDRGLTAFVVGDTPARLSSDATTLSNWGNNESQQAVTNDLGLSDSDPYMGIFYPWGYTTDNLGNNITVPPSHMMLRTIALSDNVSYPWFAPAGTRRGGITNARQVGYVANGEFVSIALNTGQRDTLASIQVNPITFISGAGLVNYGQYTRSLASSALNRINVARLIIFLRSQLSKLAKPFIFEPNDKITRDEIKGKAESLLLELVGQRAIYDYVVVCDTSNNTPARIDRNELYLDIAIEPVKAVEFIYIPLRLKNTGAIQNQTG
jgi:hypothetical protein